MAISAIGQAALISREAIRTKAYKDSVGVWTIGVGHTSMAGSPAVTPGLTISRDEALEIFARDLFKYEAAVDKAITVPMAEHERDAFVSICYNIGPGGFAKSTFVKRFNAGDKADCAKAIMAWVKPPEIKSRREGERDQFLIPYSVRLPKARSSDARVVSTTVTTRPPPKPATAPAIIPVPVSQPSETLMKVYQRRLKDLGFYGLKVDGKWGDGTSGAIGAFKHANGLSGENTFDPEMVALLMSDDAKGKVIAPERANATAADIRAEAPIVRKAERSELAATVQAAVPVTGGIAWYLSQAIDTLKPVQEFLADVPIAVWIAGIVALSAFLWWQSRQIKDARVAMHQNAEVA